MVFFAYRHVSLRANLRRILRGFSLLEIVLVLFILGLLATTLAPSVRDIIENGRRESENRTLDELAATITASFGQEDLTNLNIAALPGTVGSGDTVTVFSTSTSAPYATTQSADWFTKLARARGLTPQIGVPPTPTLQPELARIASNSVGNPRLLFVGPNETGRQRFVLISLMARSNQLTLPPYEDNAAWFDALWQNDWESRTAQPPAFWSGRLTPAQLAAWATGTAGLTQVNRLCVRRIVLPKYRVTVNNNHLTESAYVSFNHTADAFTAPPNSGANVTPEILGGRLITINRGTTWPGVEVLRFTLRENPTITLQ